MSFRLRSTLTLCLLAIAALFTAPPFAAAQQTGATVRGNVVDPDNALIPGAVVSLTPDSGRAITATSGSDGTYVFRNVPAGTYQLSSTATGFGTFVKTGIKVAAGQSLTQDIAMTLAEQSQVVQVTTSTAQVSVDPDSNASATVIKGEDLQALSDDPDELSSELSALAGPAAGPNGGQIYVDGFTGGQLPPKSSIREIRVNQNPFSAQYDRIGFGRVEVFTKPGTDKFHGQFSAQGNDNAFNTSNPYLGTGSVLPYHTIFFLGSVTGPINKNASFTLAGSHRTIQDNSIVNPTGFFASSPTSTVLCNPGDLTCSAQTGYPSSSRAVFVPQTRYDITPRVDVALGAKNTLTTRFQYESSSAQNQGLGTTSLPTTAYNTNSTEASLQMSDSQIVSAKIVNETRFEYQHTTSNQTPLSNSPTLSVQGTFTGGGSSQGTSVSSGNHIEVQNYTSIAMTKNFVRFGGRVRFNSDDVTQNSGSNGSFTYNYLLDPCVSQNGVAATKTCVNTTTPCSPDNLAQNNGTYYSSYQCALPSLFNVTQINQAKTTGNTTDFGFYLEDDWKVKPNLNISYGLRYEAQTFISSSHDFAPRLSISYGVPRKGGKGSTTVLRGGFGIFYDRFMLGNVLNIYRLNGVNQVTESFVNPGVSCQPGSTTTCGSASVGKATVDTLGNGFRSSYNLQGGLGVDQQLGRSATVSVNYLTTRGDHQFFTRTFVGPTSINNQYGSGGVYNQNQVTANINVRTRYVTLFGFESISFANANTNGIGTSLTNPYNTRIDYGRAGFTRRSTALIGGQATLPYKISAAPFITINTGSPYNITTGTDINGDNVYNDRPTFADGLNASCKVAGSFSTPATGTSYTPIPINYCTGPGNYNINLRLSRTFGFGPLTEAGARAARARQDAANGGGPGGPGGGFGGGPGGGGRGGGGGGGGRGGGPGGFGGGTNTGHKYNVTFGVQGNNIFNIVPRGTPVGTLTSEKFGQSISLGGNGFGGGGVAVRRITLQANFSF